MVDKEKAKRKREGKGPREGEEQAVEKRLDEKEEKEEKEEKRDMTETIPISLHHRLKHCEDRLYLLYDLLHAVRNRGFGTSGRRGRRALGAHGVAFLQTRKSGSERKEKEWKGKRRRGVGEGKNRSTNCNKEQEKTYGKVGERCCIFWFWGWEHNALSLHFFNLLLVCVDKERRTKASKNG